MTGAREATPADVCLVLEGTYPYVLGGVSAWVHQLITRLPEIRFAILHIVASEEEDRRQVYALPANVTELTTVAIHGGQTPRVAGESLGPEAWEALRALHDDLAGDHFARLAEVVHQAAPAPGRGPSVHDYLHGKPSWEIVRALYEARAPDVSFLDYYWTWRFTHLPVFRLLHARVPPARLYHTVSTGWAGLTASLARIRTGRPMLLTEHGIYARERRLEIDQADWIHVQRQLPLTVQLGPGAFKELWTRLFHRLSRLTYAHADAVVTIFEGNRRAQIEDGADPVRTLVIPNGIDAGRFAALPRVPAAPGEFRVGFVGRVVPIKDVRTFLRALRIAAASLPGVRGVVVGPADEDPEYAADCQRLAGALGIADRVAFVGRADVTEHYPELDVLVLTSVSEAMPLVILEAQAAGLPVVASDVGACRELLEGRTAPDRALGPSGLVTRLADPSDTAAALLALARDPALREELGRTGQARVRTFYQEADLLRRYRDLYGRLIGAGVER